MSDTIEAIESLERLQAKCRERGRVTPVDLEMAVNVARDLAAAQDQARRDLRVERISGDILQKQIDAQAGEIDRLRDELARRAPLAPEMLDRYRARANERHAAELMVYRARELGEDAIDVEELAKALAVDEDEEPSR